jgi:hypothetical protein
VRGKCLALPGREPEAVAAGCRWRRRTCNTQERAVLANTWRCCNRDRWSASFRRPALPAARGHSLLLLPGQADWRGGGAILCSLLKIASTADRRSALWLFMIMSLYA